MIDHRADLSALASDRGISLAELSRRLGRNLAYLQQYVHRGSPQRLEEGDRYCLARLLGVDEAELGARVPWRIVEPQNNRITGIDG